MNYKKFMLAAACAGMLVSCGKTPAPAAPDWSAEAKAFIAETFYNVDLPYFFTEELGTLSIDCNATYKAVIIDGNKELSSSESIKVAADKLAALGYVDLYAQYRSNPAYASQVEWSYPMQKRIVVEELGARYVNVGISGKVTEPNASLAEEGDEPTGSRYFHCEVFDPYDYSWTDSYAGEYISYGFGGVDEQGQYYEDETIASELVAFAYPATFIQNGAYVDYIDEAQAEVKEEGSLTFGMKDVLAADLVSYKQDLLDAHWQVFEYEPEEVEEGYLPRLYKYVSPSEYFEINVYGSGSGDVMFQISLLPEYSDAIRKVAQLSQTSLYEYSLDEASNTYYSYFDVAEFKGTPSEEELAELTTAASAEAAYNLIKNSNDAGVVVVDDFQTVSNYSGIGTLDVDNHEVLVSAKQEASIDWSTFTVLYYYYWTIQVSDWPEYPEVINAAFAEACGATNFHQFYEQEDGSFAFGKECESADDAAAVVTALSTFESAEVLRAFDGTYGRVKLGNYMVTVEYEATEATETEAASQGYSVTVTDYVAPDPVVVAVSTALELDPYSFATDEESGAFFIQGTEEALWAATKTVVEDLFSKVSALDGAEASTPEVQDENTQYWGSYVGTVLYQEKLIQVSTVRTDADEEDNGLYIYQIVVCEPKQDDPEVTAVMNAIAAAAGLEVEFSVIDGKYYFSEEYSATIPGDKETMVAWGEAFISTLKEAYPDLDIEDIYVDSYGDVYITIHVNEELDVEVSIADYTAYYGVYIIGAEVSTPTEAE